MTHCYPEAVAANGEKEASRPAAGDLNFSCESASALTTLVTFTPSEKADSIKRTAIPPQGLLLVEGWAFPYFPWADDRESERQYMICIVLPIL
jgi:hypothetical protein